MKTYLIEINTVDNLYANYIVEAKNLIWAKIKVKKAFFKNYPNANKNIKLITNKNENKNMTRIKKLINGGALK